jgi:hypothetical protein
MISVTCPGFEISSPNKCEGPIQFLEKSEVNDVPIGDGNTCSGWQVNARTQTIQSLDCPDKFITIGSTPDALRNQYSQVLLAGPPNFGRKNSYNNETNSRTNFPEAGASIVLSNKAAGQYQSWKLKYQRFQNVEGPFSFVNPDGLSISIGNPTGIPCSLEADLKGQTYDHNSLSQRFYLGENGHIISAQCPGLVIVSTETGKPSLQTRLRNNNGAKWKLQKDGIIVSTKSKNS